jgi:hypothetical protein
MGWYTPAHICSTTPITPSPGKDISMVTKTPTKKIAFGEQDESFVKQLARDIGCHYSKANPRTYSLNRFKSEVQSESGVFAWVHKEETNYFWVATRKIWIEQARAIANSGRKQSGISFFPRDTQLADDSVVFDTRANYEKTVNSLKLVHKMQ